MKKNIFLMASLLVISIANSQIVNIPDANLKALLVSSNIGMAKNLNGIPFIIDSNNDGEIQFSEALQVRTLDTNSFGSFVLSNIGLEAFVNLTYLFCHDIGNQTYTLDLSTLTHLEYLQIKSNNPHLTINLNSLNTLKTLYYSGPQLNSATFLNHITSVEELTCVNGTLTTINLSGLTNLKKFKCSNNPLTSLDFINGTTSIETLELSTFVGFNTINLNNLPNLKNIEFYSYNIGGSITSITIDGLENLQNVNFFYIGALNSVSFNNLPNLQKVDFDGVINLQNVNFSGTTNLKILKLHSTNVSMLNLSQLTNLIGLSCVVNPISSLNLNGLTNLDYLYCSVSNLTSLDLSYTPNINHIDIGYNPLLENLNLKNGTNQQLIYMANLFNLQYVCVDENPSELAYLQYIKNALGYTNCVVDSSCTGGNLSKETFAQKELISIFPNPVRDALTIDSTITISEIIIYNALGQVVKTIHNAENIKTIDVSDFNSGNYFMKIVTSSGVETQKFIKE